MRFENRQHRYVWGIFKRRFWGDYGRRLQFVGMPDLVIVVDVLHSRSDLPRRLAALGAPKSSERP